MRDRVVTERSLIRYAIVAIAGYLIFGAFVFWAYNSQQDREVGTRIVSGVTRSCEIRFLLNDLINRNEGTLVQDRAGGIAKLSPQRRAELVRSTNTAREILAGVPVRRIDCIRDRADRREQQRAGTTVVEPESSTTSAEQPVAPAQPTAPGTSDTPQAPVRPPVVMPRPDPPPLPDPTPPPSESPLLPLPSPAAPPPNLGDAIDSLVDGVTDTVCDLLPLCGLIP